MQNAFLSTCGQSTDAPHVSLLSHSLTWCEGHFVLPSTFACVAVSGGEVCLFCGSEIREEERDKKKNLHVVCCRVFWSFPFAVTITHPPVWLVTCCLMELRPLWHGHGNVVHNHVKVPACSVQSLHLHQSLYFIVGVWGGMTKSVGGDQHLYGFLL